MVSITSSTPVVGILPLRILLLAHATHALLYVPHPQSSPCSGTSISSSLRVPATLPRTRETELSFLRQYNGRMRMEMSSASSNKKQARGSPNHDPSSLSRERFVAAAVAVGLASGIISKLRVDPSYDITHERIFDTRRRSFLPAEPEQFLGRGFNNRIVCLGETHTHPLHHRMQFNVMKATHAVTKSRGEPFSIGLEMFYRQQQVGVGSFYEVDPGALQRYSTLLIYPVACAFISYALHRSTLARLPNRGFVREFENDNFDGRQGYV